MITSLWQHINGSTWCWWCEKSTEKKEKRIRWEGKEGIRYIELEAGCKERNTDDMTIIMMSFNMKNIKVKQIKIFKRWSMQSQLNCQFNLTLVQLINWNKKYYSFNSSLFNIK